MVNGQVDAISPRSITSFPLLQIITSDTLISFHVFPFIESHDNFYARQHDDGMICRVINESDGADHRWGLGENFARTINPLLFSWAEIEYFKFSGDTTRLANILLPIEKYIDWVETHRKATGTEHELYWSNGQASGMHHLHDCEGIRKARLRVAG